jgi:hypothetical protein
MDKMEDWKKINVLQLQNFNLQKACRDMQKHVNRTKKRLWALERKATELASFQDALVRYYESLPSSPVSIDGGIPCYVGPSVDLWNMGKSISTLREERRRTPNDKQ